MGETITFAMNLRAFVRKETKRRWTAICPSLGVASQGVSAEDAKRSLKEAVELWFESCLERGVLDQAMRETNFRPLPHGQVPAAGQEHVFVSKEVFEDDEADVLGDLFQIDVAIPAYQAVAFLSTGA